MYNLLDGSSEGVVSLVLQVLLEKWSKYKQFIAQVELPGTATFGKKLQGRGFYWVEDSWSVFSIIFKCSSKDEELRLGVEVAHL